MTLDDVGGPLATALGLTVDTTLFLGKKPERPDALVWVMEYGGMPDQPELGTGKILLEEPRLQIGARGVKGDYQGPRQLIQTARYWVTTVVNTTLNGVAWKAILVVTPPFFLQRDTNDRVEFVMNVQALKATSAT